MLDHLIKSNECPEYQSLPVDDLLRECGSDPHPDAWTEFIGRFDQQITRIISRACQDMGVASFDVVADLTQETYLRLCANNCSPLVNFRSRHNNSFWGYIKKVATSVVYDHLRSLHTLKRNVDSTVDLDHAINYVPERHGRSESLEDRVLLREIDDLLLNRAAGAAGERERKIFWLYYRDGLTAKAIASKPEVGLTMKGVESAISRLTKFVKNSFELERAEAEGGEPAIQNNSFYVRGSSHSLPA